MNSIIKSAYYDSCVSAKPKHRHNCHQLIYVKNGEVTFNTPRGLFTANKKQLVFFNYLTEHSIHSATKDYERYILSIEPQYHFSKSLLRKIFMLVFSGALTEDCILDFKDDYTEFENLLETITEELRSGKCFGDEMAEILFGQCLILFYRKAPGSFSSINDKNFDIIRTIQKRFELAPELSYSLESLSKEYNMSTSSLSHSFKKIAGTSVINYLTLCRIDKAKLLLRDANLNVSTVWESCGFSDGSNFSRLFKNLTGISPTKYRNNIFNSQEEL